MEPFVISSLSTSQWYTAHHSVLLEAVSSLCPSNTWARILVSFPCHWLVLGSPMQARLSSQIINSLVFPGTDLGPSASQYFECCLYLTKSSLVLPLAVSLISRLMGPTAHKTPMLDISMAFQTTLCKQSPHFYLSPSFPSKPHGFQTSYWISDSGWPFLIPHLSHQSRPQDLPCHLPNMHW